MARLDSKPQGGEEPESHYGKHPE
ncbi:hypothetical protein THAOC_24618, partial [Thalassiosira oceanica]